MSSSGAGSAPSFSSLSNNKFPLVIGAAQRRAQGGIGGSSRASLPAALASRPAQSAAALTPPPASSLPSAPLLSPLLRDGVLSPSVAPSHPPRHGLRALSSDRLLVPPVQPRSRAETNVDSARPISIDPDDDAATQRRKMADWVDSFARELNLQEASSVTVELMLRHVLDGTRHLPNPNALRLAAICVILERITAIITRYGPVLQTLFDELLNAAYMPHTAAVPSEVFVAERLSALGVHPASGIQRYLARQPYFEAFRRAHEAEDGLGTAVRHLRGCVQRQRSVVSRTCSAWQKPFLRVVFFAWRAESRRARVQLRAVDAYTRRQRQRDALLTHFYAWRTAVVAEATRRLQMECKEGMDQLAYREAASSAGLEDARDALEETRMLAVRLREEKQLFDSTSRQLKAAAEAALYKATEWRSVTVDSVNFITGMRRAMSQIRDVSGADFSACGELAVTVILGWVKALISSLPKGDRVKCANFGSDLRDGRVFIMLLHVVTGGDVDLQNLVHKDPRKRMSIVFDAINNLKLHLPISVDDIATAPTDYNFVIMFILWWHFALPPTPTQEVCIGGQGGFRDDLLKTKDHLDECRQFYPRWLEHRATLQQYVLYVLACRAKGRPAKVLSAEEEAENRRDAAFFSLRQHAKAPAVFLTHAYLTVEQRASNEEERARVNDVVAKHLDLLRSVYLHYASQSLVDAGKGKKKSRKRAAASPVFQLSPQQKRQASEIQAVLARFGSIDFTGFYRFCEDCELICAVEQQQQQRRRDQKDAKKGRGGVGPRGAIEEVVAEAPYMVTKAQCFQLFTQIAVRTNPSGHSSSSPGGGGGGGLSPDSALLPQEFIASLLEFAIRRHGAPIIGASEQPAPGAMALEKFINADLAPRAGVASDTGFRAEVWSPPVQQVLQRARQVLMPLFEIYAGRNGDGTMSFDHFLAVLRDVGVTDTPTRRRILTKDVLTQIFNQFESSDRLRRANLAHEAQAEPTAAPAQAVSEAAEGRGGDGGTPRSEGGRSPRSPAAAAAIAGGHEMVYGEFELGLVCVAVHLNPAPYISLHFRVQAFVDSVLGAAQRVIKADEKRRQAEIEAARAAAEDQARRELLEAQAQKQRMAEALERQRQEDLISQQLSGL